MTVEEVQAELQKMNLPRRLDQPPLAKLLRTLRRYNLDVYKRQAGEAGHRQVADLEHPVLNARRDAHPQDALDELSVRLKFPLRRLSISRF